MERIDKYSPISSMDDIFNKLNEIVDWINTQQRLNVNTTGSDGLTPTKCEEVKNLEDKICDWYNKDLPTACESQCKEYSKELTQIARDHIKGAIKKVIKELDAYELTSIDKIIKAIEEA